MIVEIGSFRFKGFHESCYSYSDEFLDYEYELKYNIKDYLNVNIDISNIMYDFIDFNEYEKDVCKEFMKLYVNKIKDVLPCWIIENKMFKFDIIDKENNIVVVSPKYYNYETDRCYCDVETNIETLNLIKWYTLNLDGASDYIYNRHKSYDGFISFIKNDINYWKSLNMYTVVYEERYLIALLDMLLFLSDKSCFEEIDYNVLEKIDKYEYIEPFVYYDNVKYTLDEFENKIGCEL